MVLRILAASDIHGDTTLVKKLATQAKDENVDLVILCGDLTQFEQSTEGIIGPFKDVGKQVLLIPGNHESNATVDFLAERYGAKNIHGYSVRYKDVGIFGCGLATIGPEQISEEDLLSTLVESHKGISYLGKKIMVTHNHPSDSTIAKFSSFVPGSTSVRKAIDQFQPDLVLCGHAHEAQGIEEKIGKSTVINVGRNGKIIEF